MSDDVSDDVSDGVLVGDLQVIEDLARAAADDETLRERLADVYLIAWQHGHTAGAAAADGSTADLPPYRNPFWSSSLPSRPADAGDDDYSLDPDDDYSGEQLSGPPE